MNAPSTDPLHDALRALPAVDALLRHPAIAALEADYPRDEVVRVVRDVVEDRRAAIQRGEPADVDPRSLAFDIRQQLYQRAQPRLRRVINATGIVLHTGLGRAPLADEALDALVNVAAGYCNLELNLESGKRGDRHEHVRELLCELTGAADAIVVNNCAAATYLALAALADGGEVIVSRGQLVEIGGSYRLPEIMQAARCRLVEVGTTNRTRLRDYEAAITPTTRALLRVHTSNYRIVGFTESVGAAALVELGAARGLPVIDDLGSGLLRRELMPAGIASDEPSVAESVAAGVDLALFSGDKLLGGPQAGIIVGRHEHIRAIRRHPLARAMRPDKLTFAALEATLRLHRDPAAALERVPVLQMLADLPEQLTPRAAELAERIRAALPDASIHVRDDESQAGGGTLPTLAFPTSVVAVTVDGVSAESIADALRTREQPIIGRIQDEALLLDVRTISPQDFDTIAGALAESIAELRGA